ncbi:hypothetical protein COCNU_06G011700 [Cocos nucifera]|uniref:Uncharacterized protein n=1 Tax=Cocos nucifera TaxID=13894 RepID=A0A8K0ID53_COCNU|nr:hypothetical protein COCNU_06G011700 [Cocos nucifera]
MDKCSIPTSPGQEKPQQAGLSQKKIAKKPSPQKSQGIHATSLVHTGTRFDPLASDSEKHKGESQSMEITIASILPPPKEKRKSKSQKNSSSRGSESPPQQKVIIMENTKEGSAESSKTSAAGIQLRHKVSTGNA